MSASFTAEVARSKARTFSSDIAGNYLLLAMSARRLGGEVSFECDIRVALLVRSGHSPVSQAAQSPL
jgi:hypothetical protein